MSDGKYVRIFQFPPENVCKFMETIYKQFIHPKISNCSNLPEPDVCPVPSGQYELKDCPANMGEFDQIAASLGVGNYSTVLTLLNNDEQLGYFKIYSSITKTPDTA